LTNKAFREKLPFINSVSLSPPPFSLVLPEGTLAN